jgi:hypothetical protein
MFFRLAPASATGQLLFPQEQGPFQGALLASTTVEASFQSASDGRILASSPIAAGGRDAALLAGWKPASTVLVVLTSAPFQAQNQIPIAHTMLPP